MLREYSVTGAVRVNGRDYALPRRPTVVITIDGGAPDYLNDALARSLMPNLASMLARGGSYLLGLGEMPSLTNPNNLSIVTGVSPAVHGICGNHFLGSDGVEVQLTRPEFLRAETIHQNMQAAGAKVLMVTAKDKLRPLLASGGVPCVSAERAHELGLATFGVEDVCGLVGRPHPDIYDPELSQYAMEIGLAVHRRVHLDLLYVTLTDYVQHAEPPGGAMADAFFRRFDELLGEYLELGFDAGITADHGMNAKHDESGAPSVHFLEDILQAGGIEGAHVVLPITDPYVRHHGALGSFAWIHLPDRELGRAQALLASLPGVEEVYQREEAAIMFEHPSDRIGDLSVAANACTALGKSAGKHDLSGLVGGLRSHGGRHEQIVPILLNRRLGPNRPTRGLRSRDIHALLLNGIA